MAERPTPPFFKYHGKTDKYSLPFITQENLADPEFKFSAFEDERYFQTVDSQLEGAVAVQQRKEPQQYVIQDPLVLQVSTQQDGKLAVFQSGLQAESDLTHIDFGVRGSAWSGLQPGMKQWLFVVPVEEGPITGIQRSTQLRLDADMIANTTGAFPTPESVLVATFQQGTGFNLNPPGKLKAPNIKAHVEDNTDPHGPLMGVDTIKPTTLSMLESLNVRGDTVFSGPAIFRMDPCFQVGTTFEDQVTMQVVTTMQGPGFVDSGQPVDGRDISADFPQLIDGGTIATSVHRHKAKNVFSGNIVFVGAFMEWSANTSLVANPGDEGDLDFTGAGSSLKWPHYAFKREVQGSVNPISGYFMASENRSDDEGTIFPATTIKSDIDDHTITFRLQVELPDDFASIRQITFKHSHATPRFDGDFMNAKVVFKVKDSDGVDETIFSDLTLSPTWVQAFIDTLTGAFRADTKMFLEWECQYPSALSSGVVHALSDVELVYNTIFA